MTPAPDRPSRTRISTPVGVVVRRAPGVTRWAAWSWRPVAILAGAGPADWKVLRAEGGVTDYHAATVPLTLHRGETAAYRVALSEPQPSVYAVLRPAPGEIPWSVYLVTASPHEAALFAQSGDEIVEKLTMPPALAAWVGAWVAEHHVETPFVKRQRRGIEDGATEAPRAPRPGDPWQAPTGRAGGAT